MEANSKRNQIHGAGNIDTVTGLADRPMMKARLDHLLPRASDDGVSCSVLFVDLKRFSRVNERFGHEDADRLLAAAARRIHDTFGPEAVVARHGGDQFIVFLPGIDMECEAGIAALKLFEEMDRRFILGAHSVHLGVRIGLAQSPADSSDPDALIHHANIALNHAKRRGSKPIRYYDHDMGTAVVRRQNILDDLQHAIDNAEFHLVFQPIYSFDAEATYGAEALLRWVHPEKGLIGPDEFIPVAESGGHIVEIGRWAFEQVCRQLAAWNRAGKEFVVSVNVSTQQIPDGLPVAVIKDTLAGCGVRPSQITIEITETTVLVDTPDVHEWMRGVEALGIRLAMDDFGTGYASIGSLHRYRMHNIKIDKSYIMGITTNRDQLNVVKAIVDLARGMGLSVTAEGVEDASTLELLRQIGCSYAQGYHLSRPVSAERLQDLVFAAH